MGKIKIIVGFILFALIMSTGWQLASCEFANYELRDDLKDVAAAGGSRIRAGGGIPRTLIYGKQ